MGFEETFRSVALTLSRSISFAAHLFIFGLLPMLLLVLRPSFALVGSEAWGKGRARVAERLEGLMQASLTATALATLVALILQFALVSEVEGGEITQRPILSVLETPYGQLYLLRYPLLAGLAVLLVGRVRSWSLAGAGNEQPTPGRIWWIGWAALSTGLLLTSTLSGHARVATPALLSITNDLLHLVCAAVWFTGIIVLAIVVPDAWVKTAAAERVRLLAPVVLRFSTVAAIAIAILGITGGINSWLHVEALNDLWDTPYGRSITGKIVVYLAILAVGGVNHFFVAKRLEAALEERRDDAARRLFRKTIALELVMALGIIGITGFLVGEQRTKKTETQDSGSGVTAAPRP